MTLFGPAAGRLITFALAVALNGVASSSPAQDVPELRVQLIVRDGFVAVDAAHTKLMLKSREPAYAKCGLTNEGIKGELIAYLDGLFRSSGKVLDRVAQEPLPSEPEAQARWRRIDAARQAFLKIDAEAAELTRLNEGWLKAGDRLHVWISANRSRTPAVTDGTQKLFNVLQASVNDPRLLDGPLLKFNLDPDDFGDGRPDDGVIAFRLAPPLMRRDRPLVPSTNVAEWERLIPGLVAHVVRPHECKLWYRDRIIEPAQDYLEVRGISVQPLRHRHDEQETSALVLASPAKPGVAGIAPELPAFARERFGGRIHLAPDPLIEHVYVELDPADRATLHRVLYLLLPSSDLARVLDRPREYLCVAEALWKDPVPPSNRRPATVRLALAEGPGAALQFAGEFMTRRALAERLQRLGVIGYEAKLALQRDEPAKRRTYASLIVQPVEGAAATAVESVAAELPACPLPGSRTRQEVAAIEPLSTTENADIVRPVSDAAAKPLAANTGRRHRLDLGAEYQAGKPLLATLEFSRIGLTKEDTWSVRLGQQSQASGAFAYSRDFFAFDTLRRRLQLSVRGFSDFTPDRSLAGSPADTRSGGGEVSGALDLWRDEGGSFSRLDLTLSDYETEVTPTSAPASRSRIRLAQAAWQVAKSWQRTPASDHIDATLSLANGHADGRRFSKSGIDLAYHRFVGALTRWDMRVHARAVSNAAPATEWPAFGGDYSVRGYRADAASARQTWALQNEYWMPLPWAPESASLARVFRRSVALAFFADLGGLADSQSALSGRKAGVGAGLRYVYSDNVTMRLDWARPIGAVARDDRRDRLYFSVSSWSVP